MTGRFLIVIAMALGLALPAWAEADAVKLYAPPALIDTGLLDHILPRFRLKTQVRVVAVDDPGMADVVLGEDGRAVAQMGAQVWRVAVPGTSEDAARFGAWLTSDVGRRTILGYAPEGQALFAEVAAPAPAPETRYADGDASWGHTISRAKCTRCHAVDADTVMGSLGSTPSFAVLRSLPDWEARFAGFFALNPHPAFTVIPDVTPAFDVTRPPSIEPVQMSLQEVEAILAYVAALAPADLGAPLGHQ